MPEHQNYSFSKNGKFWDETIYPGNYTIGGLFRALRILNAGFA